MEWIIHVTLNTPSGEIDLGGRKFPKLPTALAFLQGAIQSGVRDAEATSAVVTIVPSYKRGKLSLTRK